MCVRSFVLHLRQEAEDDERAEEAAPPRCVCTDGCCKRLLEIQSVSPPSSKASLRQEETAVCHPPGKHTALFSRP